MDTREDDVQQSALLRREFGYWRLDSEETARRLIGRYLILIGGIAFVLQWMFFQFVYTVHGSRSWGPATALKWQIYSHSAQYLFPLFIILLACLLHMGSVVREHQEHERHLSNTIAAERAARRETDRLRTLDREQQLREVTPQPEGQQQVITRSQPFQGSTYWIKREAQRFRKPFEKDSAESKKLERDLTLVQARNDRWHHSAQVEKTQLQDRIRDLEESIQQSEQARDQAEKAERDRSNRESGEETRRVEQERLQAERIASQHVDDPRHLVQDDSQSTMKREQLLNELAGLTEQIQQLVHSIQQMQEEKKQLEQEKIKLQQENQALEERSRQLLVERQNLCKNAYGLDQTILQLRREIQNLKGVVEHWKIGWESRGEKIFELKKNEKIHEAKIVESEATNFMLRSRVEEQRKEAVAQEDLIIRRRLSFKHKYDALSLDYAKLRIETYMPRESVDEGQKREIELYQHKAECKHQDNIKLAERVQQLEDGKMSLEHTVKVLKDEVDRERTSKKDLEREKRRVEEKHARKNRQS